MILSNKDSLFHSHSSTFEVRKLSLLHSYYLVYRPHSNSAFCPSKVLYSNIYIWPRVRAGASVGHVCHRGADGCLEGRTWSLLDVRAPSCVSTAQQHGGEAALLHESCPEAHDVSRPLTVMINDHWLGGPPGFSTGNGWSVVVGPWGSYYKAPQMGRLKTTGICPFTVWSPEV